MQLIHLFNCLGRCCWRFGILSSVRLLLLLVSSKASFGFYIPFWFFLRNNRYSFCKMFDFQHFQSKQYLAVNMYGITPCNQWPTMHYQQPKAKLNLQHTLSPIADLKNKNDANGLMVIFRGIKLWWSLHDFYNTFLMSQFGQKGCPIQHLPSTQRINNNQKDIQYTCSDNNKLSKTKIFTSSPLHLV